MWVCRVTVVGDKVVDETDTQGSWRRKGVGAARVNDKHCAWQTTDGGAALVIAPSLWLRRGDKHVADHIDR